MKCWNTGILPDLSKPFCVAAAVSPHNDDGIYFLGHVTNFKLTFRRGIADCVEYAVVRKTGGNLPCYFRKNAAVLCGLCDNDSPFKIGERRDIFRPVYYQPSALGITEQTHDFRMVVVANNNCMIPLERVFPDNCLHPDNTRTGGVHDIKAHLLERILHVRRDAMGPDDHCSLFCCSGIR